MGFCSPLDSTTWDSCTTWQRKYSGVDSSKRQRLRCWRPMLRWRNSALCEWEEDRKQKLKLIFRFEYNNWNQFDIEIFNLLYSAIEMKIDIVARYSPSAAMTIWRRRELTYGAKTVAASGLSFECFSDLPDQRHVKLSSDYREFRA